MLTAPCQLQIDGWWLVLGHVAGVRSAAVLLARLRMDEAAPVRNTLLCVGVQTAILWLAWQGLQQSGGGWPAGNWDCAVSEPPRHSRDMFQDMEVN